MGRTRYLSLFLLVSCSIGIAPVPAQAQDDAAVELDHLVMASAEPGPGVVFARAQALSGDPVAALVTLERILIVHPEADEARLLHIGLLCRLDDPSGARAELTEFAGRSVPDAAWAEVETACGPLPRPAQAETGDVR